MYKYTTHLQVYIATVAVCTLTPYCMYVHMYSYIKPCNLHTYITIEMKTKSLN